VLKTALVMLKGFIVFELGDQDGGTVWERFVTVVFLTSFIVLALMTLALAVPKVWKHPQLLEAAGIESPRIFLVQYMMSYIATKLGVLLLMLAGRAPDLMGCHDTLFVRNTTTCTASTGRFGRFSCQHQETTYATNWTTWPHTNCPAPAAYCQDDMQLSEEGQACYECTSCKAEFFSTNTLMPLLLTLLWLPFAVYSNNETAQIIDGLWWQHMESQDASASSRRRVGLSTAQHGAMAVSPLVQVVVMGCVALSLWPSWFTSSTRYEPSTGHPLEVPGEYNPAAYPLPQLAPTGYDDPVSIAFVFNGWPQELRWTMVLGVLLVNTIMLGRALLNCHACCAKARAQTASAPVNSAEQDNTVPLLLPGSE
jgi:hypothetical protein